MSWAGKFLQPNSLYITLAIPHSHTTPTYPTRVSTNFDADAYITGSSGGRGPEEFEWGIYWHREYRDGVWYQLERDGFQEGSTMIPRYKHLRWDVPSSPRLEKYVVCIVRMVRLNRPFDHDLAPYIDWVAQSLAKTSIRSILWATTIYFRVRNHLLERADVIRRSISEFTLREFLIQVLTFAYASLPTCFEGLLPRPIMITRYGIHLKGVWNHPEGRQVIM
ncbi:hypothetical protein S40285_03741 [Stachybotrys chlorohalonatus IBT 40285]|uniref:Uncharacterized protein n=1 Tax=Stachybotrys chlorohalonatus (strain IBT 40285) TaxID=1283841 RepID=A0A084QIW8_STAC4|nr:hypothetical protein S40285_03741 [Stachybotrys chlorohalonata IBT 40285]